MTNRLSNAAIIAATRRTDLDGVRIAITGGTSGLGLALVRELLAPRRARRLRGARAATASRRVARAHPGAHGIVGDVARKEDIHPIALQIAGQPRRPRRPGEQRVEPRARRRWRLLADTECEDFELALATNVLGPFRLTKALLGALAASAREGRGSVVLERLERRRGQRLSAVGRLRREQGRAAPPRVASGTRSSRPRASAWLSLDPGDMDTPLHALAVPDADAAVAQAARDRPRASWPTPSPRRCPRVGRPRATLTATTTAREEEVPS